MNERQTSKLSTYYLTKEVITDSISVLNPFPNFTSHFAQFTDSFNRIIDLGELRSFNKQGIAVNKMQARNALCEIACNAVKKLQAYALAVNNNVLLSETNFTNSHLKKTNDHDFRNCIQCIYDRTQTHLAAMSVYGVSADTQTDFLDAINTYVSLIPKVKLNMIDQKHNTAQLANAFDSAEVALKNIDAIIETLQQSHPVLYTNYKQSRKTPVKTPTIMLLEGTVADSDGQPVKYAQLKFRPVTNGYAAINSAKPSEMHTHKTNDKGTFSVKTMPDGVYNVTVSKVGYQDQNHTVTISQGESAEIYVQLAPVTSN